MNDDLTTEEQIAQGTIRAVLERALRELLSAEGKGARSRDRVPDMYRSAIERLRTALNDPMLRD